MLGQLNSRLAAYIEKVRSLELENGRLEQQVKPKSNEIMSNITLLSRSKVSEFVQVSSIEETRTREITSVRGMYDKELSHARRALDETAKDKAKFEIEAERHKTNAQELKGKLTEKSADAERAERASVAFENQLAEAKKKNDDIAADKNRSTTFLPSLNCYVFDLQCCNHQTGRGVERHQA